MGNILNVMSSIITIALFLGISSINVIMKFLIENYSFIPVLCAFYGIVIFCVPYLTDKFYKWILAWGTRLAGAKLVYTGDKGYAILSVIMALAVTFFLTLQVVNHINSAHPESGVMLYYICQYASWISVVVIALILVIGCLYKGMVWSIVIYKCVFAVMASMGVWMVSFSILTVKNYVIK